MGSVMLLGYVAAFIAGVLVTLFGIMPVINMVLEMFWKAGI